MSKSYGLKPRTAAGKRMSIAHLKATIKLDKKKTSDHLKGAKKGDKAYHMSHAKAHKKDVKDRVKYLKKVAKLRVKAAK